MMRSGEERANSIIIEDPYGSLTHPGTRREEAEVFDEGNTFSPQAYYLRR